MTQDGSSTNSGLPVDPYSVSDYIFVVPSQQLTPYVRKTVLCSSIETPPGLAYRQRTHDAEHSVLAVARLLAIILNGDRFFDYAHVLRVPLVCSCIFLCALWRLEKHQAVLSE